MYVCMYAVCVVYVGDGEHLGSCKSHCLAPGLAWALCQVDGLQRC